MLLMLCKLTFQNKETKLEENNVKSILGTGVINAEVNKSAFKYRKCTFCTVFAFLDKI